MNKSPSGLSQRWDITKGSTPCSENDLSTRSETLWNNFISLPCQYLLSISPTCYDLVLGASITKRHWGKMVVNNCCCAPYIGSAPDQMPRLEASVCACMEDLATDPVKQWPAEREGSLMVHRAGLLFSLALYWAMIGPNLAWSSAATNICLW